MRYRNIIYSTIGASLIFAAACTGNSGSTDTTQQNATTQQEPPASNTTSPPPPPVAPTKAEPANLIPDFTFYKLKSGFGFGREDLSTNGNIVFILFDPGCSHCQHEAAGLGSHYEQIKGVNLYFVSMIDPDIMSTFFDTYAKQLNDKSNITVLYDRNTEFMNKFHVPDQYPATYVYGADGILKEYWTGERDIEEIIPAINQ